MGSIRPLVTITILAVVGAYLYVKINEGPVPSRAGANSLSQSPEGVPPLTGTKGTSLSAQRGAPAWPSTAVSAPPPLTTAAPAATTASISAASSPVATTSSKDNPPAVLAIPELPPLPVLKEPAPLASQPSASSPKDSPASNSTPRYPDQPGPSPNAAATKDALSQPAPLTATTTDLAKASPSTSPAQTPVASAASPPASLGTGAATSVPSAQSSAQNPLRAATPATTPAADPSDRYATTAAATPAISPATPTTPTTPIDAPMGTSFAASWPAIQSALDRRDLKQAHQLLSKWHGDESLNPTDTQKVETLLSQLAGTVIYSIEHQLEPARIVKPGETLDAIAKEYNVTPQLLGKINGIQSADQLRPGQELKVVRGPFAAVVDLSRNEIALSVDERYAGKFRVTVPPGTAIADGQWLVDQKLAGSTTTASPSAYATTPIPADRSIVLRNAAVAAGGAPTLIISSGVAPVGLAASAPSLRVSAQDAEEISDILSVGSRVVVRK